MSIATVTPVLDTSLFLHELKHRRRENALADLASFAHSRGTATDPGRVRDLLVRRERSYSSAVGRGVAVPHLRSIAIGSLHVIVARARKGIDWKARDGQPVQLVLAVLAPSDFGLETFLDVVQHAVAAGRQARRRQRLLEVEADELAALWREVTA